MRCALESYLAIRLIMDCNLKSSLLVPDLMYAFGSGVEAATHVVKSARLASYDSTSIEDDAIDWEERDDYSLSLTA